jgi:hypothetical protein
MAKKANKNTFVVNEAAKTVTFGHTTKTSDGEIYLKTTFDFSEVGMARLIYDAGTARLIKWRQASGIKEMTTSEAEKKFTDLTVDCSKVAIREKADTPSEVAALAKRVKQLMSEGYKVKEAMTMAMAEVLEQEMEAGDDATAEVTE